MITTFLPSSTKFGVVFFFLGREYTFVISCVSFQRRHFWAGLHLLQVTQTWATYLQSDVRRLSHDPALDCRRRAWLRKMMMIQQIDSLS